MLNFNWRKKIQSLKNIPYATPVIFLVIFALFYYKGQLSMDPDFGWRIKAGEYYWNNGIPETDIFSYTMPNFPWVDHAWGTTLIFYLINNYLGYPALVFLMTVIVLVTLFVLLKTISDFGFGKSIYEKVVFLFNPRFIPGVFLKLDLNGIFPFSFFPFVLAVSILLPFFGVRAQVMSWFMFSVLIYWIINEKRFNKVKYFLPAFFLIWVNLHGSFALGLGTLFLFLGLRLISTQKIVFVDSFIGLFSFIVTFINPYGSGVWREVWSSASDSKLRWSIAEWMPALTMFDLAMVFLICLSIVLIWKYRKNYTTFELVLYYFLLFQAISSRRQLPLWMIITLPLVAMGMFYFWKEVEKIKGGQDRFVVIYKIAWILSICIFLFQVILTLRVSDKDDSNRFYPVSAVVYLNQNEPEGEIFSEYGWGGYLIQNLPRKKVFVDGRMPSWRWNPENSSDLSSSFDTYSEILKGETDYKVVFEKYGVDTVLSGKGSDEDENVFYRKIKNLMKAFGWQKNDFNFLEALESDGWEKVYEDDVAVIYRKS